MGDRGIGGLQQRVHGVVECLRRAQPGIWSSRITYGQEPAKRFPSDPIDPRNSAQLYPSRL
jgi:hypothetical protein